MKIPYVVKKGLTALLTGAVLLGGCGNAGTQETSGDEIAGTESSLAAELSEDIGISAEGSAEADGAGAETAAGDLQLIEELQQKYAANSTVNYSGDVIEINRDEAIQLSIGYNPWEKEEHIYDSFVVYQDDGLQYPLDLGVHDYDAETGTLIINPPYYGIAEMDDYEADLSHLSGSYLMEEDGNAWGNLSQYYLAAYVDAQTGEPLAAPVVTVIKIKPEIKSAPQLVFDQTEEGYARFSWKEVPGADGYLLFLINKDETGFWENAKVFADVKGTEWTDESEALEIDGSIVNINERFQQYYISDDTGAWMDEAGVDWGMDENTVYNEFYSEYFGVIAYNAQGSSSISNLLSAMDLAHMLPTTQADYSNEDSFYGINATLDLPAVMCVTMCDGSTAQKVLDYDMDSLERDEENDRYTIKARAIQTPFTREFLVYGLDWSTLEEDLVALEERQEKLQNKGGNLAPSISVDEEPSGEGEEPAETEPSAEESAGEGEGSTQESAGTEASVEEPSDEGEEPVQDISQVRVTANSAMSEYVALQMLSTSEAIDLSAFPEAADVQKIKDAFFEAQYQNPLILGVQGGGIDTENRILYVNYDFDRETTAAKQEEIEGRVEEIVSEIISDGMTELEKEMAINAYLCENARYDDAALENAEKYNFATVDQDFYDSFTAYGVLVDGVGVCASYSAAFKLLADAAGLESIVVTGYLEGSVPHAWNKVRVDGDWYIVDSTNNDNELIANALLNLSDDAAWGTLVENDSFVLDGWQQDYAADRDTLEYYHTTSRYYEQDEISGELAALLASEGKAVLRTDYDIDDEAFYEIATDAANAAGKRIRGFYWMGVIHLEE